MALNFVPYPVPPQPQRPNLSDLVTKPLLEGLDSYTKIRQQQSDDKFRQMQIEMMKAKEAREQGQYAYDYGDPNAPMTTPGGFAQSDPRLNLYQPATMPGESQYGNIMGGAQPDSYAPRAGMGADANAGPSLGPTSGIVDRFRQWQQSRKEASSPDMSQDLTNDQLFAPGFGAKRREDYQKTRKAGLEVQQTQAETALKNAQAKWFGERQSNPAGGLVLTPAQSSAVASGDPDALRREFPNGVPLSVQNSMQTAHSLNVNADRTYENQQRTREDTARGQFQNQNKDFFDVHQAFQRVTDSSKDPSAAGDLALIYNYMKMLDPGSVVREGEFATAAQAGSIPTQLVARYNRVVNGERLSPDIRKDFIDRAGRLYSGQRQLYESSLEEAKNVAKRGNLDPERAVIYKPSLAPASGGAGGNIQFKIAVNKKTGERMRVQSRDGVNWEPAQ